MKSTVQLTKILDLLDQVDDLLVDIDWQSSKVTEKNDPLLLSQDIQDIAKHEIKKRELSFLAAANANPLGGRSARGEHGKNKFCMQSLRD